MVALECLEHLVLGRLTSHGVDRLRHVGHEQRAVLDGRGERCLHDGLTLGDGELDGLDPDAVVAHAPGDAARVHHHVAAHGALGHGHLQSVRERARYGDVGNPRVALEV